MDLTTRARSVTPGRKLAKRQCTLAVTAPYSTDSTLTILAGMSKHTTTRLAPPTPA